MCPLVSGLCHCIMSSSFIHVVACVNSIFFSRLSNISYVHILHFACFFIFTFLFYWLLYWRMVVFRKVLSQMLRSERERNSKTLELAEEKRASSYPQTLLNRLPRWRCAQSCLTLGDPMDYSPPGSSVHGILQARILDKVAMPSSRGSSQPKDWTQVSHIADRFFTSWASREAL